MLAALTLAALTLAAPVSQPEVETLHFGGDGWHRTLTFEAGTLVSRSLTVSFEDGSSRVLHEFTTADCPSMLDEPCYMLITLPGLDGGEPTLEYGP